MKNRDIIIACTAFFLLLLGIILGSMFPMTYTFALANGTQIITESSQPIIVDGIEYKWILRQIPIQSSIGIALITASGGLFIGYFIGAERQ